MSLISELYTLLCALGTWRKCHGLLQPSAAIQSVAELCSATWTLLPMPSVCVVTPHRWSSLDVTSSRSTHLRRSSLWRSWIYVSVVNRLWTLAALMWCGTRWKRTCWPRLPLTERWSPGIWENPPETSRTSSLLSTNVQLIRCVSTPQRFTCCSVGHRMALWSALICARRSLSALSQVV